MCIHALVLLIVMHQGYIKLEIVIHKHAKKSHAHVSQGHKSVLCASKVCIFVLLFFNYYFRDTAGCHFQKINFKKTKKMQIFTDDCPIYQI